MWSARNTIQKHPQDIDIERYEIASKIGDHPKSNLAHILETSRPLLLCKETLVLHNRGFSFERNCVLRRWESETLKYIISHNVNSKNEVPLYRGVG